MARHVVSVTATALFTTVAVTLVAGLAGCAEAERPTTTDRGAPSTERPSDETLPAELQAFLDRAEAGADVAFTGAYEVTQKLGARTATVEVSVDPPAARIGVDDLVMVAGPHPATCLISAESCVGEVREQQLAPLGLFSGFYSAGPAQALRTAARRPGAGDPLLSNRSVAGAELDCVAIAVGGVTTTTSCLTAEGIFGWVDTPAVHYELTRYAPGPPSAALDPPYPVTDDDSFLRAGSG